MSTYYGLYLKLDSFLRQVQTCPDMPRLAQTYPGLPVHVQTSPDVTRLVCNCEYMYLLRPVECYLENKQHTVQPRSNIQVSHFYLLLHVYSYNIALFNIVIYRGSTFHMSTHYRLYQL
jgi:hypothetical protein